jgi:hypothetical protein
MGRAGLVRPGCPPGRSATLLRAIFGPRALALRQMLDNGGGRITRIEAVACASPPPGPAQGQLSC